jgi:hypothetical protein
MVVVVVVGRVVVKRRIAHVHIVQRYTALMTVRWCWHKSVTACRCQPTSTTAAMASVQIDTWMLLLMLLLLVGLMLNLV